MARKGTKFAKKGSKFVGWQPKFGTALKAGKGGKLNAGALASSIEATLDEQHRLQFVVKWTKSRPLVLLSLQTRVPPDGPAHEVLNHPQGGNSGELSADMGVFKPGAIGISFIIGALSDIKQAATFVVEDTTHATSFKPGENDPLKSLKQGDQWLEKATFTVGAKS